MRAQTPGQIEYNRQKSLNSIPNRILGLLESTNGGVVTYRLIEAVCWPDGKVPQEYHYFISLIRSRTGKGIDHHTGVGYRRAPELDQHWAKEPSTT